MDDESGLLKMWQIWALYDIAADFYADPENQAAFEACLLYTSDAADD